MSERTREVQLIRILLARLERISADSVWAHRASGIRGALLNLLENYSVGNSRETQNIQYLLSLGFDLLEKDAQKRTH